MTINLTETSLYIGIIIVLIAIQIYQQTRISRLEKDIDGIWEQMATLTSSFVGEMLRSLESTKESKTNK
jgi:hypothetical protein